MAKLIIKKDNTRIELEKTELKEIPTGTSDGMVFILKNGLFIQYTDINFPQHVKTAIMHFLSTPTESNITVDFGNYRKPVSIESN